MLFPTAAFTLAFLPIVLGLFFLLARRWHYGAAAWLFLASLFFYGYWMPQFTLLLVISIIVNFRLGMFIAQRRDAEGADPNPAAKRILVIAIAFNLALLAYFKYANFFLDNLDQAFGARLDIGKVSLPIGISFFTFTQIAFLADAYSKGIREYRFAHYGLFVTYFPHLVAGPVLHHAQMMPQFASAATYRVHLPNLAAGLAIFAIGLIKKVVLADGVAPYADAVFDAADAARTPGFNEAWIGALAYTLQLYFDFSGYSDMAIGLSLLFNVRLPYNFDSPYKSRNIAEFWRRWHMTLSAFLRDYLYISLGGNRLGPIRRHANLMITMLLGGLWHGASWTFVAWGAIHGAYLVVNHALRALLGRSAAVAAVIDASRVCAAAGVLVTFLCTVVAWVFFRSHTFAGASLMLQAMTSGAAEGLEDLHPLLWNAGLDPRTGLAWCGVLASIVFLFPNSNAIGEWFVRRCESTPGVRQAMLGAALFLVSFLILLSESRDAVSAFIYFNF